MKVIGAGLPRTGTLSQKAALEQLGVGPCQHMANLLANLDAVPSWRRALDGDGEADWDQLFAGFQSVVDWPGSFFWRELIDVYPDAKVLLSVREGHSWARSMRDTIWGVHYGDIIIRHLSDARCVIDPKWRGYISLMKEFWRRIEMAGDGVTEEEMITGMERYHDEVKQTVPSDRLLVWSVTDGWGPLADFLGVPEPEEPFPHLNDSKIFIDRVIDGSLGALQRWRDENREEAPAAPVASSSGH